MVLYIMCIGSAGHSSGNGKAAQTKADGGYLSCMDDIQDCEKFFTQCDAYKVVSGYAVKGLAGNAQACFEEIRRFYTACRDDDATPLLYYTGHGNSRGDWVFADGRTISIEQLTGFDDSVQPNGTSLQSDGWCGVKPPGPSYPMKIMSDCCYSGRWVDWVESRNHNWQVVAASSANRVAHDRVFADAVFKNNSEARSKLIDERKATCIAYGGNSKGKSFDGSGSSI